MTGEGGPAGCEESPGLTLMDVLALPDPLGGMFKWLLREQKATLADVADFLGHDEPRARAILADLLGRGLICETEVRGVVYYRVRLARKRGQDIPLNLWEVPEDK